MPENEKTKEEKLQRKFMEFQVMEQQIKQLESTLQNLDSQLVEIKNMQSAVKEMEKVENNSETLVPVVNGIFVKGTIKESKIMFVNVGSNIIVDKTVEETVDLLEKQVTELNSMRQQFLSELQRMTDKMGSMEIELQDIVSEKVQ